MNFKEHSAIKERHAFLSPSTYHWLRYDEQKLEARYYSTRQAARGTALHELAHTAITLGVRLSSSNKTLSAYVKDGIGFRMAVEQPLYYSDNCFGHADTISFRRNVLRISDLKTGITLAKFDQLEIYAAIFCLEYDVSPFDIKIELRIYQNDEVRLCIPDPQNILDIMDKIIYFDQFVEDLKGRDDI